jgi:hypothetical protein
LLIATTVSAYALNTDPPNFSSLYKDHTIALKGGTHNLVLAEQAGVLAKLSATEYGTTHDNTINLNISAANHYRNAKENKLAAKYYDKALALFDEGDKTGREDYLSLLVEILKAKQVVAFKDIKNITKQLYQGLEGYFESTNPEETIYTSLLVYQTIVYQGALSNNGRKILNLGKEILEVAEKQLKTEDLSLIKAQFAHGKLLVALNRKKDAIAYFTKVIDITESAVDFTHPYALGAHAQLVGLYESQNDSESATEHCLAIGSMKPWRNDIKPSPLYRINPLYPVTYARQSTQGLAIISFDISPFGFVQNAQVMSTEGGELFGIEGIRAVNKWRYAPKFEDGKAVVAKGLKVQLDFAIGNNKRTLKNI